MRKRVWRIASRTMLGLACVALLAVAFGGVYEIRRERYFKERHAPPGDMVDIGTHRLHMYCEGSGEPPVLLEAGSGLAYINWHAVQAGLSPITRVCSYDRSGLGWSEMGPQQPSANQAAEELARLLDASRIAGPWVVVGHSLGGLYAQQFLNLYPEKVAALVLLDSSHDGGNVEKLPQAPEWGPPGLIESIRPLLSLVGLHRLSLPDIPESDPSWIGWELHSTAKHVRRAAAEWWSTRASAAQVREKRADWGDTPLLVIQAGTEKWPASFSDSARSAADRVWTAMQKNLASRSSQGRYYVLAESGHGIPWEQPQAVIADVDSIVQQLRQRSTQ